MEPNQTNPPDVSLSSDDVAVAAQAQRVNTLREQFEQFETNAKLELSRIQGNFEGRLTVYKEQLETAEKELAQLKLPKEPAKVEGGTPSFG